MFKKIFEKLKKAAAWVADKVKKAIDWVRNHKEVVVAATVGGLACVAAAGFVSMTHDPNMYPDISTKASVAEDKIREAWDVYEKYKDVHYAPVKSIYTSKDKPINTYTLGPDSVYEFENGYYAHMIPRQYVGSEKVRLSDFGKVGEMITEQSKEWQTPLNEHCVVDDVFMVVNKEGAKLDYEIKRIPKEDDNG